MVLSNLSTRQQLDVNQCVVIKMVPLILLTYVKFVRSNDNGFVQFKYMSIVRHNMMTKYNKK